MPPHRSLPRRLAVARWRVLRGPHLAALVAILCLQAHAASARAAAPLESFLQTHCLDCHGPAAQEGGFRVDSLSTDLRDPDVFETWVLVHDRVRRGEMPPEEAEQPAAAEKSGFVSELRRRLLDAERRRIAARGSATVRRMNRAEYEHTLRDLLALPLLRVRELLPEDGRRHGFDKVPAALELSHVQIAKYLEAADKALRQAIVDMPSRPETTTWRGLASRQGTARAAIATHNAAPLLNGQLAPGLSTRIQGNPIKDIGNSYRSAHFDGESDAVVVFSGVLGAHQPQGIQPDQFRVTVPGWYRVQFSTWSLRWERGAIQPAVRSVIRKYRDLGEPIKPDPVERWKYTPLDEPVVRESRENVEFHGDAEAVHVVRASLNGKLLGFFDAPSLEPTEHEFRVWLEPGERISFHVMSLPATGPPNWGTANGVRSYDGPGVVYDWFEIEGPLVETWPPRSQQRLFGTTPVDRFPRPPLPGKVSVGDDNDARSVPLAQFAGAGHHLDAHWMLNIAGEIHADVNFTRPGTYELRVTACQTPAGDEPAQLWTKQDGREIKHGRFQVRATPDQPRVYQRRFEVPRSGPVRIGLEFPNDYFDERTKADRNLIIRQVEVAPVELRDNQVEIEIPDPPALLARMATRAFRRPVTAQELRPYVAIVERQLEAGQSFQESMIAGYKALLCSPDFLFLGLEDEAAVARPEAADQAQPTANNGPASQYALASRLSYFLWNSLPDDTLRKLAAEGRLSEPETLLAQVDRLLADPRSDRFVEHFLDQWLEMKDIDFTTPDPQLYPEFDPWLRDSMLAETRAYFRKLIRENRSIDHLVDSDFVLINQRLAELYGIRGVTGAELREVRLPEGSLRGGFLGQAAVLKVTANGTATSPVLRGAWVTERILGIPRRPPPPNIPAVEPDVTGAVTIREQIEKHRSDPACARCHRVIDPPGLALESFDVIGGLRQRYRASGRPRLVGKGPDKQLEPHVEVLTSRGDRTLIRLGGTVDPSGQLPDGRDFENVNEFRQRLLADRRQLATNLARQLAVYATGRGYRFSDREAIDAIVDDAAADDFGIRSLIDAVVLRTRP